MARCLLYRGLLDQALDYADLAIDEERKSGRPATLCRALVLVFPVFLASRNAERSAQCVAQMADLSASYSLIPYRALAVGQRGQLLVLQGKVEDGIPLLRQALKELHAQREGCGQAATSSRGYIEYAFGRAEVRSNARTMPTLIPERKNIVCNLYSITTNQAAIIPLFRVMNRYVPGSFV